MACQRLADGTGEIGVNLPSDEIPCTHFSGVHVYDLLWLSAATGCMMVAQAKAIARVNDFMIGDDEMESDAMYACKMSGTQVRGERCDTYREDLGFASSLIISTQLCSDLIHWNHQEMSFLLFAASSRFSSWLM